jgi:hypothetical protein
VCDSELVDRIEVRLFVYSRDVGEKIRDSGRKARLEEDSEGAPSQGKNGSFAMGHPGRRRLPRLRRKHLDRTAVTKRSRSRKDLSTCSGRHTEILRHGKTVFVRVPHVRYREKNLIMKILGSTPFEG